MSFKKKKVKVKEIFFILIKALKDYKIVIGLAISGCYYVKKGLSKQT